MEYDVFCPDCGTFIETLAAGESLPVEMECQVCGAGFKYGGEQEYDDDIHEEIRYEDLDDSL